MKMAKLVATGALGLLACIGWTGASASDPYPQRFVTLVVPFPAGGSFDVIGRLAARALSEKWGHQVVVENKPGAAGDIGAASVAKAAPDGYTLLLVSDGLLSNDSLMTRRLFDPLKDFKPVTLIARSPQVLVGGPALNTRTLVEMVKQGGGTDYRFGTAGTGTPGHLVAELLAKVSGLTLTHVPYRGGAPALTDVLGGQIELVSTGLPALIAAIQSGSVVPLAVSSEKRFPSLPDVPTMAEIAPGASVETWYGIVGPAGLPDALRDRIHADTVAVMQSPAITARLIDNGFEFVGAGPAEFSAAMARDLPRWREIVTLSGLKPQ
ncbi:Bug family tripartite tricarboxylate transporter substrate binding protein [Bosea sp. 2RAB26]|uniref:Bug family tripartite tricarboxylate transporter substrate binding protein n=1 Tax=Bosea sp. 2RAB26 TaxID=3237476 RepID=UPI003F92C331